MPKNNCIGKILSMVLIIITAAVFIPPSLACGSDGKQKFVDYVSSGNYFQCSIPADWSMYEPGFGLSADEKKVYGVTLFWPANE